MQKQITTSPEETTEDLKPSRSTYLGGADVACVLGCGFKTAFELWQEKVGQSESKDLSDVVRVRVGSELEEYVLKDYEKRFSCNLTSLQEFRRGCHKVWAGGTVDALDEHRSAVVDAKVHFGFSFENDELPTKYLLQALWYCYVFEKPRAYFHVLHLHASSFRTYEVELDEHRNWFFEEVLPACEEFWRCVQESKPPRHTPNDTIKSYINALESKKAKELLAQVSRTASFEELEAIDELIEIKAQEKLLDERKKAASSKLANAFREAEESSGQVSCQLFDVFDSEKVVCKIIRNKNTNEFLRFSY